MENLMGGIMPLPPCKRFGIRHARRLGRTLACILG